jgi:hypothetical protein
MMSIHQNHTRVDWNDDNMAELKRRLLAGESASIIAAHFGLSRSAIIGKVDRNKNLPRLQGNNGGQRGPRKALLQPALPQSISLGGGAQTKASTSTLQRGHENQALVARVLARQKIETGAVPPPVMGYQPKRFHEGYLGQQARVSSVLKLEAQHCKFPIDLPNGKTGFCGDVKEDHSSYCPHHAARCFNPESAAMRKRFS